MISSLNKLSQLDRANAAFAKKENALILQYARSVIEGLILIYKDAKLTGDTVLNIILGPAPFIRETALAIVMNHDVYAELRKLNYTVNFWYEYPHSEITGLVLYMGAPPSDDTQIALEKIEEYNARKI